MLSLVYLKPAFVALVAVALVLAAVELHEALKKQGMDLGDHPHCDRQRCHRIRLLLRRPARAGDLLHYQRATGLIGTDRAGEPHLADAEGCCGLSDAAASMLIIGYVPLLGSFAAMLAEERGSARLVTFLLIVVMNDTGGYVAGVLFGKHPMVPKISPKKSWEGLAGSLVFGTAAGVCMAVFLMSHSGWASFSA